VDRISIIDLVERIPDEASAYAFMEKLRWPDKPVCPHCGSINDHTYLNPENGVSRRTRTGKLSQRRVWKCRDCKRQFSVITNTPMHGSKVPLRIWIFVLFEMCANKNGIAAREIARKYSLTEKTAWFVTHRIRLAMERHSSGLMAGTIVSDETWIGGNPQRMNHKTRERREERVNVLDPYPDWAVHRRQAGTTKTPVVSLINSETGEVRSRAVASVNGATLKAVITQNVNMGTSTLFTDENNIYKAVRSSFAAHHTVNHAADEYFDYSTGASTNKAENYFSQLKRSLDGTHHNISVEHLPRYLAEFDFRYSTRKMTDTQRMDRLMGQTAGRRMTYRRMTGS
jgi:transposase-like protein